jgi:glycosyltransferase involved in cell wall biosynthesis
VAVFKRRSWQLPIFHFRVNQVLYHRDLSNFLARNDVVFFEWASELLVAASHLPKVSGIVTRLHRYEMYQWVNRINWEAVDKIILVSHAKKKEFIAKFPTQADKIVVSGPSTSLEKFTPQPKTFNGDIGILCHLTPRKRVYDLILTFYELLQQKNNLHLHVAGGMDSAFEDYYYALQSLVVDLGIQEKVTFYGNVKDTWNWYHKVDIFISNSYSEGLQVAPMEAMASGCYCLAHHWRGAEELLPPKYLYYTDTELRDKILQYCKISDTEKLEQKKCMRTLAQENFDIKQTIKQVVGAVDEVAATIASGKK